MLANRVVTCWDYHHGQSTRILVSGFAPLSGATMREKQDACQRAMDGLRAGLLREPRGHRNMLGAIITDPVSPESLIGVIFTSPHGYFEMCGDSSFSLGAYLFDAGIVQFEEGSSSCAVSVDTVAGPIELELKGSNDVLEHVTIGNVPSRYLGDAQIDVPELGTVDAEIGYGGLTYAFVKAIDLGVDSLDFSGLSAEQQRVVIERGSALLEAAKSATTARPVELVTLTEATDDENVSRVANFYAPGTMGRTPSGTGLSARLAVENAKRGLETGTSFSQQSALGLRFRGEIAVVQDTDDGAVEVIPRLSAVSHLMSVSQQVFKHDDPFVDGFWIDG